MRPRKVTFEQVNEGKVLAYVPTTNDNCNSAYRGRVKHVGTIEKRAGKWFWFLHDDSDAGMASSLSEAMEIMEARA